MKGHLAACSLIITAELDRYAVETLGHKDLIRCVVVCIRITYYYNLVCDNNPGTLNLMCNAKKDNA